MGVFIVVMSAKFLNMLNVRTRAIPPEYVAQWKDIIYEFDSVPDGVDYLEAEYPYSVYNGQISALIGTVLPSSLIFTINDQPMQTIDGQLMETIS